MKKILSNYLNLILISVLIIQTNTVFSQKLELKWSEKILSDNKKDGFFNKIINSDDKNIYVLQSDYNSNYGNKLRKLLIVAYDKFTLVKTGVIHLKGFKDNEEDRELYKKLKFGKVIVLNNAIFVFWSSLSNREQKEELYCETFSSNLKRISKLIKVCTAVFPKENYFSNYSTNLMILSNNLIKNELVIGYDIASKEQNVVFNYLKINSSLDKIASGKVVLPTNYFGTSDKINLEGDGNLTLKTTENIDYSGKKKSFDVLSSINVNTGEISSFSLKKEGVQIVDYKYVIKDEKLKVYGFYSDLSKDVKGNEIHGFFYVINNTNDLNENEIQLASFSKKELAQLFVNDLGDKNDSGTLIDYRIEKMFAVEDENVVLFCSKMYNYEVATGVNSNGNTTYARYCQKSNVTAFKLNSEGEIVWANNLDRVYVYSNHDIYDLNVICKNNLFYVTYGSEFVDFESVNVGSYKEVMKTLKNKDQGGNFEYAIFNNENGRFEKQLIKINDNNSKEIKKISAVRICEYNDEYIIHDEKTTLKIGKSIPFFLTAVLAWVPIHYGSFHKETLSIGVLKPQ